MRGRRAPTTTEPHHGTYVAPVDSRERSRAGVFRAPQHRVPTPTSERRSNIRSTVIRWIANRPDEVELPEWNRREAELIATDPDCVPPLALPPLETGIMLGSMSGVELSKAAQEAARTIPAREHGSNCDIKNISRGSRLYFPVYVPGAKLSMDDYHFSQGDGEITFCRAIEMAGWMDLHVDLIKGGCERYGIEQAMPLYDYECQTCGPFRDWAAMADYAEPQACPQCNDLARRSLSAPHCRTGSGAQRYKAEAFNERSANKPKTVSHVGEFGKHAGRDGHRHHDHARSELKKNNRPWMIGH